MSGTEQTGIGCVSVCTDSVSEKIRTVGISQRKRRERVARSREPAICKCCGEHEPTGLSHWRLCMPCHWMNSEAKTKAQALLAKALRCGVIKPAKEFACIDCGAPGYGWDHRSYQPGKELDVVPVCRTHNALRGPADFMWMRAIRKAESA